MGRRCRVKDCLSDSRRPEDLGVTFHKVPFHSDIRPKWLSLCKIVPDNQSNKIIYVCSRHFRRNDFCTFKGTKYMLRQGVLPSMFPWTDPIDVKTPASKSKSLEIKKENTESESEPEPKDAESNDDSDTMKPRKPTRSVEKRSSRLRQDKEVKPEPTVKLEKIKVEPESVEEDEGSAKEDEGEVSELKDSFSEDFIPVTEFTPGSKVEVTDFSGSWLPAKISEVDYTENEVFIEFDESTGKSSEWIPMDSKRLRQIMERTLFEPGEKVMATWRNSIKFPATIVQAIDSDNYEVLFEDNIQIVLKASKISKAHPFKKKMICSAKIPANLPSPLFAPVEGSKQDRRARKRKLNVCELFNKKRPKSEEEIEQATKEKSESEIKKDPKKEPSSSIQSPRTQLLAAESGRISPVSGDWICRWENGEPVGTASVLDSRKSVIVNDPRIPDGWNKHFVCRAQGTSAGKWDAIIVSPEGKKFRSKSDLQTYIEKEKLNLSIDSFDFSLHLKKARALGLYEKIIPTPPTKSATPKPSSSNKTASSNKPLSTPKSKPATSKTDTPKDGEAIDKNAGSTAMKIIFENGAYKCPVEGCAKNFRKENLAQMHVKHYHPEFSKFVGSTPNVADLAYARTVGDAIEDFLPKTRLNFGLITSSAEKKVDVKSTPRTPVSKQDTVDKTSVDQLKSKDESVPSPKSTKKDSEIVKILNSDTKTPKSQEILKMESKLVKISSSASKTDSKRGNFTSEQKRDIKSPESKVAKFPDFGKKDEAKPSGGIKTLLPVVRATDGEQKPSHSDGGLAANNLPKSSTPLKSFTRQLKTNRRRNNSEFSDSYKRRRYTKHDYDYYTDIRDSDSKSPDYLPSRKKKSVEFNDYSPQLYDQSSTQTNGPQHIITETGEVIKIVTMKQEEIINCTCGLMEEDGLMIQCELCLCWQHAYCNNIEREDQVPDKYICYICQNPLRMRASKKYVHDQDWLKHGILPSTNFHVKDEKVLYNRFENLRISHELSGNLRELSVVLHSLKVKLKIVENKDHPKFYLWSKPWPKSPIDNNFKDILENYQTKSVEPTSNPAFEPATNTDIESSLNKLLNSGEPDESSFKLVAEIAKQEPPPPQSEQELLNILQGDETSEKPNEILDTPQEFLTPQEPPKQSSDKNDTKTWIDGEVMSGEVSDGEMISQALASEALASDLLSSPTTALNLTLTQSDIEKIQKTIDNSGADLVSCNPCIPEPEDKIESAKCRENLIENISYYQKMVDSRMDAIEQYVIALEKEYQLDCEDEVGTGKIKETLIMVNRDLNKMRKMASLY